MHVSFAVERVFEEATNKGADALLVTALDEVGWLLNLRGSDVNFNPVFISYVIITGSQLLLACI